MNIPGETASTEESPRSLSVRKVVGSDFYSSALFERYDGFGESRLPNEDGVAFASIADELANDSIITAKLSRQVPLSSSTETKETAAE